MVAKKLNVSRAADDLFLSQSSLSRKISSFEQELGVRLFERHSHGLKLTSAGERLAEEAVNIFDFENSLIAGLRELSPLGTQSIRIGYMENYFSKRLMDFLVSYDSQKKTDPSAAVRPEVDLMSPEMLRNNLLRGAIDIAVCISHVLDGLQNIDSHLIYTAPSDFFVSAQNHLAGRIRVTFEELRNEVILLPNSVITDYMVKSNLGPIGRRHGFTPVIRTGYQNYSQILKDVALNRGITLIGRTSFPEGLGEKIIGKLAMLRCDEVSSMPFVIAWNRKNVTRQVLQIADEMLEYFRTDNRLETTAPEIKTNDPLPSQD